ncbi:MAG: metalloregulator ArsR/SmtB family transcription factor [Candidatus Cloacimonetes bacterium]|nr:metalloregulator ArsR/SmtB family transcription factor [Candidatus Cloacimonadota bacterium]
MIECLCKNISAEELDLIKAELPEANEIGLLSQFFKVFGDPTRLKILYFLYRAELCVADLSRLAEMQQPAVSQHLKTLRLSRLVKYRKEGKVVYYSLDDDHVQMVFNLALSHVRELRTR